MTVPDDMNGDLFPWEVPEDDIAASPAPPSDRAIEPTLRTDPARSSDGRTDERAIDGRASAARAGGEPPRERTVAQREYYAISEVCDIVGLKPHVLRYWESQFPALNPSKNRSGNRVYQRKEIRLIMLVKRLLYEDKYTIEGARARIEQMRRSGKVREMAGRALDAEMVGMLRTELEQLRELLTPPA